MRCTSCHGLGYVAPKPTAQGQRALYARLGSLEPCPDCTGGVAHCCDGLIASDHSSASPIHNQQTASEPCTRESSLRR